MSGRDYRELWYKGIPCLAVFIVAVSQIEEKFLSYAQPLGEALAMKCHCIWTYWILTDGHFYALCVYNQCEFLYKMLTTKHIKSFAHFV